MNIRDFLKQVGIVGTELQGLLPDLRAIASDPLAGQIASDAAAAVAAIEALNLEVAYAAIQKVIADAQSLPADSNVQKVAADFAAIEATLKLAIGDL